jgi:tetratricopeptide (TPR) repeat protein
LKSFKLHILLALLATIGLFGCATNKNTRVTRTYHRVNTRYNGYFYAREAIKDGVAKIDKSYVDDYSNILPLFKYAQKESLKMASGDMDKAIKKSTSAIERHMITDKKNVEIAGANIWIEDCWLAIGKARFYKQEYFAAVDAFDYVTRKYAKRPIRYEGFLWLIRTYNETSIFSKSEELITLLKDDKKFPKKKRYELYALSADYCIKREMYEPAIGNLTKAITLLEPAGPLKTLSIFKNGPLSANNRERARYIFVLAQLNEKMGDTKRAAELFSSVVRLRPSYDMEFNARLSRARLYDFSNGKGDEIIKELKSMLKDFKNEDYRDQIYYTLAGIELREKHEPQGIEYLKRSVAVSLKNPAQKALSFLKLADLYYDRPDYKLAQAYYDSVVPLIRKDYPNYELIIAKQKNLTELVKNLKVITAEDSLQRIAGMDSTVRIAFIDNLIAKAKEAERKKEEERLAAKNNPNSSFPSLAGGGASPVPANAGDAASWYFYNPTTVGLGIADFRKKWGDRKLEDNWRRLNKEVVSPADIIPTTEEQDTAKAVATRKDGKKTGTGPLSSRSPYLKNLPFSKEALDRSNIRIVDAYYNIGMLYKEALMNNAKAAATFEEMLGRFPQNKYIPTAYYFQYRLYLTMENQSRADYYRDLILKGFPDSELAELLKHPENIKNAKANQDLVKAYYTETYAHYLSGHYAEVMQRCNTADSIYGGSKLSPKFAYLHALAIGRTGDRKAFALALTSVTLKYPKDEVKVQAQGMLDMLKRVENHGKADAKADSISAAEAKKDKYVFDETLPHYTVIVIHGKVDMNTFKAGLSDFNQQYFGTQTLSISSIPVAEDFQIVKIKEFADKKAAMTYYEFVKGDKDVFKEVPIAKVEVFVMSADNFTVFYHEKNTEEYKAFFNANYFKTNP